MSLTNHTSNIYPGRTALIGFICGAILCAVPLLWTDSPVVQRSQIVGQIIGASPSLVNPKGIFLAGLQIEYDVDLSNGRRVRLRDSGTYPVGMHVFVERSTRSNGSHFYTLVH